MASEHAVKNNGKNPKNIPKYSSKNPNTGIKKSPEKRDFFKITFLLSFFLIFEGKEKVKG